LIAGVLTCVLVVGATVMLLNRNFTEVKPVAYETTVAPDEAAPVQQGPDQRAYRVRQLAEVEGIPDGKYLVDEAGRPRYEVVAGIGSKNASAPQARLMSLVIRGILSQKLPWGLVLIGVFLSLLMELLDVPALAFAVGVYLPLESTTPVFAGGLVRWLVDRRRGSGAESDAGPGILYSSGLIAGASLMGLGYAVLVPFDAARAAVDLSRFLPSGFAAFTQGPVVGLVTFLFLAWLLHRAALSGEGAVGTAEGSR